MTDLVDPPADPAPANPTPVDPPQADPPKPDPATVTLTQEELSRKMAREKQQGSDAATTKLANELGMSFDEAKTIIADHQKREEANKSELQKLTDENARLKTEKESQLAAAQQEHHTDRIKTRLLRPGLLPKETAESDEALDRVVGLIKAQTGASAEDIDADIESLKGQFPQLFTAFEAPKDKGTPSGVPSGTPRKPAVTETRQERVARIAAASNQSRGVVIPTT